MHEFLLYAERRTSFVEPSAITVTQRMPADGSLNLVPRRSSLEYLLPERTRIVRFVCSWTGKDPVSLRRYTETAGLARQGRLCGCLSVGRRTPRSKPCLTLTTDRSGRHG